MAPRDRKNRANYSSRQQFHYILFHMNFKYESFDVSCYRFQRLVLPSLRIQFQIPYKRLTSIFRTATSQTALLSFKFPSYSIIYSFLFVHNSRLSSTQVVQISFTINILDSPQNYTSINLIQQVSRDYVLWGASHFVLFTEYIIYII